MILYIKYKIEKKNKDIQNNCEKKIKKKKKR